MECLYTKKPMVEAGRILTDLLDNYQERPVLLLLSAGSAFALLDHVSTSALDSRVTIGVIDERFSADEKINNFAQLTKLAFFNEATEAGSEYIDTRVGENESLEDYAIRFEKNLSSWLDNNQNGVVLATLGMGKDGHTAGIMPGQGDQLAALDSMAYGYELSPTVNEYTKRVTVTPFFLMTHVTAAVAVVANDEKRAVLKKVLANEEEIDNYPALLWHAIQEVTVVALE